MNLSDALGAMSAIAGVGSFVLQIRGDRRKRREADADRPDIHQGSGASTDTPPDEAVESSDNDE
ncbi:hypothetical protein Sdia_48260 [Streptomyces diastaticus subsp. diastaticus]|uniref:Uncharacterized protein n=1 Tax=Streptomyces diastaticus subsp. diastaticus TaxID=68040 RepID=A0ABQ1CV42_STRDI|nr:hypothetical protein [Streptomyces diastaticus]GFH74058.1 hypothetical protein Sdia_48260 [Streptomyces diastaticus subsp. diastaticus]GGU49400.1 hypothetical protein GCM10015534_59100 [Streptomyces diastaticus subsp. diastaticus]